MSASYDRSVFVNCPFDPDYAPVFDAVMFAVHNCGFIPRCALEEDDSARPTVNQRQQHDRPYGYQAVGSR